MTEDEAKAGCLLSKAIEFAAKAHAGQVDKAGEPYILHPLRVMLSVQSTDERIVAMLHDVIEDTAVDTSDLLNLGLSDRQIEAVVALTRLPHETYDQFIERVALNPLAAAVKLADIADNMSPARAASRPERLTERYTKAWIALGGAPAALASREPSEAEVERVAKELCQCDERDGAAPWGWYDEKGKEGYIIPVASVV